MSWEDYSAEQNKKNPFENHACGFRQGKEYQIIMEKTEIPVIDVIIPAYRPDDSFHKLIRLLLEQSVKPHHIYVLQTIEDGEQVYIRFRKRNLIMVPPEIMERDWQ